MLKMHKKKRFHFKLITNKVSQKQLHGSSGQKTAVYKLIPFTHTHTHITVGVRIAL